MSAKFDKKTACHSEPRSGEESRELDTEAAEYGILHFVQDDRFIYGILCFAQDDKKLPVILNREAVKNPVNRTPKPQNTGSFTSFRMTGLFTGFFTSFRMTKTTCHSEPRSGEESREQDTEATEYGILHFVQDDR